MSRLYLYIHIYGIYKKNYKKLYLFCQISNNLYFHNNKTISSSPMISLTNRSDYF